MVGGPIPQCPRRGHPAQREVLNPNAQIRSKKTRLYPGLIRRGRFHRPATWNDGAVSEVLSEPIFNLGEPAEFLDSFIEYMERSGTIEASTLNHYRKQAKVIKRYIGDVRLADVSIPAITGWMAQMTSEGYAPRSVAKPFALLKQAMKHAMALDLIAMNPCEYCKPPKLQRRAVNALSRSERTRMLELARSAEPAPLALAIEIALTTGMRRGVLPAICLPAAPLGGWANHGALYCASSEKAWTVVKLVVLVSDAVGNGKA